MSHLAKLQSDFQAYLIDNIAGDTFKKLILNDAKVGAEKRLNIYANAYRIRIAEALATAYPKLKMLLGDDLFEKTAQQYLKQHPSTHQNMRWVGSEMASLLVSTLPQHPIAAEMAKFEWALGLAFDAEDVPVMSLQDLAEIPPESWPSLTFKLHSSVQLLPLNWNVVAVWNALNQEKSPPNLVEIHEPCLVWRQGMDLGHDLNSGLSAHFRSIEQAEFNALYSLLLEANFGELCANLQDNFSEEEATMQAAQYLSGWLNAGLISHILAAA